MHRVVVHVFLEGFLRVCRGRPCEELLSIQETLDSVLAEYGSGWRKPAADEAILVRERPWEPWDASHRVSRASKNSSPMSWATSLRDRLSRELRIDCSMGIAATPLAARICSRLARPRGILLWMPGYEKRLLGELPLEELEELRPEQVERLRYEGIRRLDDMALLSPDRARAILGTEGPRVVGLVRGIETGPETRASRAVALLSRRLSHRLQAKSRRARGLELLIVYGDGVTRERYTLFASPADGADEIREAAMKLFAAVSDRREPLVGLSLNATGLTSLSNQLDLFSRAPTQEVRVALGRVALARLDLAEPAAPIDSRGSPPVCSPNSLGGSCS